MKAIKSCILKLVLCLLVLVGCLYFSNNEINTEILILSFLSCRYFIVLCVEAFYAKLDSLDYLPA